MPLRATIDATKNWSGALNRLGFGFLAIFFVSKNDAFSLADKSGAIEFEKISFQGIAVIVLVLFLSMVLGSIVLAVGNFTFKHGTFGQENGSERFSERAKAVRAYRVGSTQNPLLAELMREGTNKYEQAAGLFGLFWFSAFVSLFTSLWLYFSAEQGDSLLGFSSSLSVWGLLFGGITFSFSSWLIWNSATNTISALDAVLDEYSQLEESNKSTHTSGTGE